jgi:ribonucleotide reductase beta subunit family protein with ferritin-like domain
MKYPGLYKFREEMEGNRWTAQEVRAKDRADWKSMTADEKQPVRYALGFFAVADTFVLANLPKVSDEVDCMEAQRVYAAQVDQEAVHEKAYMLQAEAITDDQKERDHMFQSMTTMKGVRNLIEWAKEHLAKEIPIAMKLVALVFVEGVIFSALFAIITWVGRTRNLLPGVTTTNDFIVRDEGIHTLFSCELLKNQGAKSYLLNPPTLGQIKPVFDSGMKVLAEMLAESFAKPLPDLNAELLTEYAKFQADVTLSDMNLPPLYKVANPLKFMDKAAMNATVKVNFFERQATQYRGDIPAGSDKFGVNTTPVAVN